mgnify:CR=1 FL=1
MSNYRLYTTKSCILCQKAKKLIESQQLNVEIVEACVPPRHPLPFRAGQQSLALCVSRKGGACVLCNANNWRC